MTRHGANRFITDLVEAAESRGYQLVALDVSGRLPWVRLRGLTTTAELQLTSEYGIEIEPLIGRLPRGDEERPLT